MASTTSASAGNSETKRYSGASETLQSAVIEAEPRPRLRQDLIVIEQQQDGATYYVIKDPVTSRYFRVAAIEFSLIKMFDGRTPLTVIAQQIHERHGYTTEIETLRRFVSKLTQAGFMASDDTARTLPSGQFQGRRITFFQRALFIRLKAVNPDRLFNFLIRYLGFFFTKQFVILAASVILYALFVLVRNWHQIGLEMRESFAFNLFFIVLWVTAFVVAVLHEFAHGLTCKRFGGEVKEIGFLLIYFNLALYCNVSDTWLFRERSKRLWVMFAGGFFETFIWGLAVITWSVIPVGNFVSKVALTIIAISGVKILLNFIPLIKLDGYYLLSDYLELPNLRARSFDYLKHVLKNKVLGRKERFKTLARKERIIYLVFSLLATPFSATLILYMLWRLMGFLVFRYGTTGIVISALVLLLFFGDLVVELIVKSYDLTRRRDRLARPSGKIQEGMNYRF
jgi:putative peptide zinc metalloprotease protein